MTIVFYLPMPTIYPARPV